MVEGSTIREIIETKFNTMQKLNSKTYVMIFAASVFVFSRILRQLVENNSCGKEWSACVGVENLLPIFYVLFVPALLLYFFQTEVQKSWFKLLAWYVPLTIIFGLPQGSSWGPSFFSSSKDVVWIFSINIVVFSIILFVIRKFEISRIAEKKKDILWIKWPTYFVAFFMSFVFSVFVLNYFR